MEEEIREVAGLEFDEKTLKILEVLENMDIEYPVKCPLMERDITAGECFDIHMVVDGWAPEWTAPQKATTTEGYKNICQNCIYHRND